MKIAIIGTLSAMFGVAFAVAGRSGSEPSMSTRLPPDCAVAISSTIGLVPRAGLMVENRTSGPVQVFVEARGAVPRVELGTIGGGERRMFAHTLPAGRNALLGGSAVEPPASRPVREVVYVLNQGAATCRHRYLWRIE